MTLEYDGVRAVAEAVLTEAEKAEESLQEDGDRQLILEGLIARLKDLCEPYAGRRAGQVSITAYDLHGNPMATFRADHPWEIGPWRAGFSKGYPYVYRFEIREERG